MENIEEEPLDFPEGLLPPKDIAIPVNFERDEWEALTEVIITVFYHAGC
jgi:hypothetical protein